jgi:tetraprenyl-beta-curcumene synthase
VDYRPPHSSRSRYGRRRAPPDPHDAIALVRVQGVYWLSIYPQARRELDAWRHVARTIPDAGLREHALGKLAREGLNAEGAALFAVLAPRTRRRHMVRLLVAYQVLYDFLDAVNEDPRWAELQSGLRLHRALTDAVRPDRATSDYYVDCPGLRGTADGGYSRALTQMCRRVVRTLPAASRNGHLLEQAAERCAEAQSHNHAMPLSGESQLIEWSVGSARDPSGRPWWELAAAGVSSLAIHAQLASAADPANTPEDAILLDAAYFPSICALSTLLDSLADYYRDAGTANHSFIARYRDVDHAAERLVAIGAEAADRIKPLRNSRAHAIILAGIVAYYLSSPSVEKGFPAAAAERLTRYIGPLAQPMRAAMRARRRMQTRSTRTPTAKRSGLEEMPATPEAQALPERARR